MRDPKRINTLLTTFKRIWRRDPDLRFTQLMSAFEAYMKATYQVTDLFYIEDEKLDEYFLEFEKKWFGEDK